MAFGWAGNGIGKNAPDMESVRAIGPLPKGLYSVGCWEDEHPGLGPIVAPLTQIDGQTFGRDGFFIHGPAKDPLKYGQESKGCIVIPRTSRMVVRAQLPEGSYLRVEA